MTAQRLIFLAAVGSAALLAAAFVFQNFGWAPCKMCLWQRWPHVAAVILGCLALLSAGSVRIGLSILGSLSALTTAAIAGYHGGVERKWWDGPASCSGGGAGLGDLSAADLIPGASDAPALVMCDTLAPYLFGLTMANWNMLASLGLALIWGAALKRSFS